MNAFRIIAFLEGVSYILLLGIAVPIKYINADPTYVKLLGMPHGILFVAYVLMAFKFQASQKWTTRDLGIVLFCSILPFGTFYADKKYLR
ncbi:MAG: DUF3817 domain-containing protein [Planctomycetes bacterium]|nr:DUF3817 domain-containing protein [Planctomycetota bacterium]